MTARYALVGCGASKIVTAGPVPAKDLYTSTYFAKKREFAERHCDAWWVLSAKHEAILSDATIQTYDRTMDDVQVEGWARSVRVTLHHCDAKWVGEDSELVVLAGRDYVDPIRDELERMDSDDGLGVSVRFPFDDTSGIGEQLSVLNDLIDDPDAEVRPDGGTVDAEAGDDGPEQADLTGWSA